MFNDSACDLKKELFLDTNISPHLHILKGRYRNFLAKNNCGNDKDISSLITEKLIFEYISYEQEETLRSYVLLTRYVWKFFNSVSKLFYLSQRAMKDEDYYYKIEGYTVSLMKDTAYLKAKYLFDGETLSIKLNHLFE